MRALLLIVSILLHAEPVGRAAPNVPKTSKSNSFDVETGKWFGFLCEAQALPVPMFR
jgi:hypothetical protein